MNRTSDPELSPWLKQTMADLPPPEHYSDSLRDISVAEYAHTHDVILGSAVVAKHRIYLDQNYWNYCRDAARGCPQRDEHVEILSLLRRAVAMDVVLCPTSHVVLLESMKQADVESRRVTAALIDELSGSVCLKPYWDLFGFEIRDWILSMRPDPPDNRPALCKAWTYPVCVLGPIFLSSATLSDDETAAVQKVWMDVSSNAPFSMIVNEMPTINREWSAPASYYARQNTACATEDTHLLPFPELFLQELQGALLAGTDLIGEACFPDCHRSTATGNAGEACSLASKKISRVQDLVFRAFERGKIDTSMPMLRITAGLHAALTHKRQKRRMGDMEDHMHAALAIPYCNAFFTEHSLGNLLTRPPLDYDKLYDCRVLWSDDDIIEYLNEVHASAGRTAQ